MKRVFFYCILLLALLSVGLNTSFSQSGWFWQNPLPQGNPLYGVFFTSASTGIAVGVGGTILRTTNGGTTWAAQASGTTSLLIDVFFVDANIGAAVGQNGAILRTTNGGTTWTAQTSGTTNYIYSVDFTDANTGTAVGGSGGTILRTTNGGATWTAQASGVTGYLYGVDFTDANTGTAVGDNGAILRTTNGGTTWTAQTSGVTTYLVGVSFTSATTGTAVGGNGTILRTTNGGTTWTAQTSGTTSLLYGVAFADANIGTAVGDLGTILRTTNGGTTWTAQTSGTSGVLWGISFTDANTGTTVGPSGAILRTTNGGTTWTSQTSGSLEALYGVSFTDANTGTAVGTNGTILRTSDAGNTWTAQTSPTTEYLRGVSFISATAGIAVGYNGAVLRTSNGGSNWYSVSSPTTNYLYGVSFSAGNTATAVGAGGVILRTTNGGASWTAQTSGTTSYLYGVSLTDANTGTAVGSGGTILRTAAGVPGPVLVSPANASTGQPVALSLTWNPLSWASSYVVQVSTSSSFGMTFISDSSVGGTSRALSSLAPNTTYYWRVAGKNYTGLGSWSSTFSFSTVVTATVTGTVTFPATPAQADYRMVGVPGASSTPVSDLVDGSGGSQKYDWRAFRDPGSGSFTELGASDQVNVGEGVWLIRKNTLSATKSPTMPPLGSNGTFSITIHNGWNIVANPFDRPVNWTAVRTANSLTLSDVIQSWSGSYAVDSVMQLFKGYYFLNNSSSRTTLAIPYPLPSTSVVPPENIPGIIWALQVVFESADNIDSDCHLGVSPGAASGLDSLEIRKPPMAFAGGEIYFSRPGWDEKYSRFSTDYRPLPTGSEEWDFEISHPKGCDGKLRFKGVDQIPLKYKLVLIAPDDGKPIDLRAQREYRIQTPATKLTVKILVGLDPEIERKLSELVPSTFGLWQNFPNPFNPTTTLRYGLPVDSRVSLKIYNILGQVVATLVDGVQAAGYKEISFGGKNLPSGVYLYRLQATAVDDSHPPYVAVKKMVLTK